MYAGNGFNLCSVSPFLYDKHPYQSVYRYSGNFNDQCSIDLVYNKRGCNEITF